VIIARKLKFSGIIDRLRAFICCKEPGSWGKIDGNLGGQKCENWNLWKP